MNLAIAQKELGMTVGGKPISDEAIKQMEDNLVSAHYQWIVAANSFSSTWMKSSLRLLLKKKLKNGMMLWLILKLLDVTPQQPNLLFSENSRNEVDVQLKRRLQFRGDILLCY